jgi:hypothetical protein
MPDNANTSPMLLTSPASSHAAIVPDNSNDLNPWCRAIYVGVGGDIQLTLADGGNTVVYKAVPQGSVLSVRARRVWATNTTASSLIALW